MAITHMVWIKFNDAVAPATVDGHLAGLSSLQDTVPGITSLTIGANFTDRANGFTHGLLVVLPDKAALETYITHPDHVAVATALRRNALVQALDYES
jgi:hypothetical protein